MPLDEFDDEIPSGLSPEDERQAILEASGWVDRQENDEPDPQPAQPAQRDPDSIDRLSSTMERFLQNQQRQQPQSQAPEQQRPQAPSFDDYRYSGEGLDEFSDEQRNVLQRVLDSHGVSVANAVSQRMSEQFEQLSHGVQEVAVSAAVQRFQAAQYLQSTAPDVASAPEAIKRAVAMDLAQDPGFQRTTDPNQRIQMFAERTRALLGEVGGRASPSGGASRQTTATPRGGSRSTGGPKLNPSSQAGIMSDMLKHEKSRNRA